MPENLAGVAIDDAERIPDAEALEQIFDVLIHEGLSVGTSSGINIAAAIRVARDAWPWPHGGDDPVPTAGRGISRNCSIRTFLREKGLPVPSWMA